MNFLKQQQEERERQDQQWIVFIRQQLDAAKYEAADLDVVEDQEQRDARIDALVGRLVKIAAVACYSTAGDPSHAAYRQGWADAMAHAAVVLPTHYRTPPKRR